VGEVVVVETHWIAGGTVHMEDGYQILGLFCRREDPNHGLGARYRHRFPSILIYDVRSSLAYWLVQAWY